MPTVLALTGRPIPERLQGLPLTEVESRAAERPIYSETFYPRLHMGWSELASLVGEGYHYIEGPDPELYHLPADPQERSNLLRQERRVTASLRQRIQPFRTPLDNPAAVDPETMAKLAALGYTASGAPDSGTPLPDPKARIFALDDLKEATRLMGRREWARAAPLLERTLAGNPRMQDVLEKLALCLQRADRRGEAVEVYRRALENSGGSAQVALSLSSLLLELGRWEEARAHAELALPSAPALAHRRLAEIALAAEDLASAERHARQAVAAEPDRPAGLCALVQVLARQGKLPEAGEAMRQLESILAAGREPPPGFHLVRGDLHARLGRAEEARQDFEEEIRRNPDLLDAHTRLAVLLVAAGEPQRAWRTLQRMVEVNGDSAAAYASAVEALRTLGDAVAAGRLLQHARSLHPGDPRLAELAGG
jgi:tetratricopeptide (TPR) repeat protein